MSEAIEALDATDNVAVVLQLAGYERAKALARALANRPRIILAAAPTAALDSKRAGIVMDLLRKLAIKQNTAIIAVTHDDKIFDRFDQIFHLRDGLLVDEASRKARRVARGGCLHTPAQIRFATHELTPA